MAKRDYYECSGVEPIGLGRGAQERLSAARHAASPGPQPGRQGGRGSGSRRSTRPTRSSRTRRSAPPTTSSATRRSRAARRPRRAAGAGSISPASPTSSTICSATSWAAAAARPRRPSSRGADLRYNLTITLEEAFAGKQAQIRVPTTVACEVCSGTGSEAGRASPAVCPSCRGAGRVRSQQGFFTVERTCPTCQGTGRVIKNPCRAAAAAAAGCSARRRSRSTSRPASRTARASACPARARPASAAAQPGDLYIFVSVAPHRLFRREGTQPLLPGADPDDHGGAGRPGRGADHRGPARCASQVPAGTQTGKQIPAARQGHDRAARPHPRRHVRRDRGRDAGQPDQAPAGAAARVRAGRRDAPTDTTRNPKASSPR